MNEPCVPGMAPGNCSSESIFHTDKATDKNAQECFDRVEKLGFTPGTYISVVGWPQSEVIKLCDMINNRMCENANMTLRPHPDKPGFIW